MWNNGLTTLWLIDRLSEFIFQYTHYEYSVNDDYDRGGLGSQVAESVAIHSVKEDGNLTVVKSRVL